MCKAIAQFPTAPAYAPKVITTLLAYAMEQYTHTCPACGKSNFRTAKGLLTHIGQAKDCLWYRKGKLQDLGNPGTFEPVAIPDPVWEGQDIDFGMQERDNWEPEEVSDALDQEFFDLIPVQPPPDPAPTRVDGQEGQQPIAGPSDRIFSADEGWQIVVEHRTAAVIVKDGETELQHWRRYILGERILD